MFPANFGYVAARSVEDALQLMAKHGEDGKLLAGGHSLIPAMKLRLQSPQTLIDLGTVTGLRGVNVAFSLSRAGRVKIDVFSLSGKLVAALCDGDFTSGGHTVSWSRRDARAGCHIVKIRLAGRTQTATINLFR